MDHYQAKVMSKPRFQVQRKHEAEDKVEGDLKKKSLEARLDMLKCIQNKTLQKS